MLRASLVAPGNGFSPRPASYKDKLSLHPQRRAKIKTLFMLSWNWENTSLFSSRHGMPRKATYIKSLGTSEILRLFLSGPEIHLQVKVITSSRSPSSAEGTCPIDVDVRDTYTSPSVPLGFFSTLLHLELQSGAQDFLWLYLQVFMSQDAVASSWSQFLTSTWKFRNTGGKFSLREGTRNLLSLAKVMHGNGLLLKQPKAVFQWWSFLIP